MEENTTDKQLLLQQAQGLRDAIAAAKRDQDALTRAAGIDETIEQARAENETHRAELEAKKKERSEQRAKRGAALSDCLSAFAEKMNSFLVEGSALFRLSEDGNDLTFFLVKDDTFRPYITLSSGEKVDYNAAMAEAFTAGSDVRIITIEAGEMDAERLQGLIENQLTRYEDEKTQLIVCFHHGAEHCGSLPADDDTNVFLWNGHKLVEENQP